MEDGSRLVGEARPARIVVQIEIMVRRIGIVEEGAFLIDKSGAVVSLEIAATGPSDGALVVDGSRGEILVVGAGQVDLESFSERRRAGRSQAAADPIEHAVAGPDL